MLLPRRTHLVTGVESTDTLPIPTSTLNATEAEIHIKSIDQAAVSTTVANVKKICRLDELKDFCCCYCWAIEAHVHTVGIVVRNSELPYSYHVCPTMPYLLGFWYFLPTYSTMARSSWGMGLVQ